MGQTKRDEIPVRRIDAKTGKDFTELMKDPSIPPGEGIPKVARALGRLMAAPQIEAERQLLQAVAAVLHAETNQSPLLRNPQPRSLSAA